MTSIVMVLNCLSMKSRLSEELDFSVSEFKGTVFPKSINEVHIGFERLRRDVLRIKKVKSCFLTPSRTLKRLPPFPNANVLFIRWLVFMFLATRQTQHCCLRLNERREETFPE